MNGVRRGIAAVRTQLTRRRLRIAFLGILVVCSVPLAYAALTGFTTATKEGVPEAPPTKNHTVVTESARYGTIIAYAPNGSVAYYNETHTKYFDVDPVEGTRMTVEYAATDTLHAEAPRCQDPPCARNVVERANLSTGEVTEVYARYDYRETAGEWHDADRINETHVVVADMIADQVLLVDTETEMIEWTWDAQIEFPVESGGPYPGDWTHLNDVEVLDDGRLMVSLRNHDQVVFIDPGTGMQERKTLGEDGDHDVMHQQHNPDYIPEERGGPAVVVADSENGRVEEFRRENGTWNRTWEWSDRRMQWPRDADRLPNGNTLIADTHGKRVIEVNPSGEIVWNVSVTHPYDAERLETGDESTGGHSAAALDLTSRDRTSRGGHEYDFGIYEPFVRLVRDYVPSRIVNAAVYVTPTWMGIAELGPAILATLVGVTWGVLEVAWVLQSRKIGVRSPVYRRDD